MRSIATSVMLMALVTSPAWAHDPSCVPVYTNNGSSAGLPIPLANGGLVLDDVHTSVPASAVCAVDVKGRAFGPGVLSLYVFKGSPSNDPPGALLVGPVDIVNPPLTSQSQTLHYELPETAIGQDLWIGVGWVGGDGLWVGYQSPTPTLGTSQDVFWVSNPNQAPGYDDEGSYVANTYLVVYASVPTPTQEGTWGQLKAIYR